MNLLLAMPAQADAPALDPVGSLPIAFYLIYAAVAAVLVVWLARTLHRSGGIFLSDVFDSEDIAKAVNQLLVIGFYLLNMGYALLLYQLSPSYRTITEAWNQLANRLGVLFVSLAILHMANLIVLWRVRTWRERRNTVPVAPIAYHPPPQGSPLGARLPEPTGT